MNDKQWKFVNYFLFYICSSQFSFWSWLYDYNDDDASTSAAVNVDDDDVYDDDDDDDDDDDSGSNLFSEVRHLRRFFHS